MRALVSAADQTKTLQGKEWQMCTSFVENFLSARNKVIVTIVIFEDIMEFLFYQDYNKSSKKLPHM